jgi:CDP-diacylglycerol--glycerol-3-phosphate 3-phosphatidyltransferase
VFIRSIPNLLGVFRIFATPLQVWLILNGYYYGAVVLLLIIAASDIADGPIARRLQIVSPLGVFLDTISDKIFVAGALIPMVERGLLSTWIALLIIVRDFAVSGLRSFAAAEGEVISARQYGKQKLVITVTAIVWRLVAAALIPDAIWYQPDSSSLLRLLVSLWPIPMFLAVAWTIFSGVDYFWKAWPLLNGKIAPEPKAAPAPPAKSTLK